MDKSDKISEYIWFCDITDEYDKLKKRELCDGKTQSEFINYFIKLIEKNHGCSPMGVYDANEGAKNLFNLSIIIGGNVMVPCDCTFTYWKQEYNFLTPKRLYLTIKTRIEDESAFDNLTKIAKKFGGFVYHDDEFETILKEVCE